MKKNWIILGLGVVAAWADVAGAAGFSLVPLPAHITTTPGTFVLNGQTAVVTDSGFTNEAEFLAGELSLADAAARPANQILLTTNGATGLGEEAYALEVNPAGVTIRAATSAGAFYGCETLRQLIDTQGKTLPGVMIADAPRYAWRGFMLDVSRHFFDKPTVLRLLDLMAYYKLNRFHIHLTDDPAWRLEIPEYPALSQTGARGNFADSNAPAQFFTRGDIQDIVAYAQARHIVVIPEIDMPGHAGAAIRTYPKLDGGEHTFNPAVPDTDEFLKNVWHEVLADFPSPWIHFGGDEVDLKGWNENQTVTELMHATGLTNTMQVEQHFLRQTSRFLTQQGRVPVGWDEIVAARPERGTVIFWWRHNKPEVLRQALAAGYSVVLTPRTPCYFDYPQDAAFPNTGWKLVNTPAEVYKGPAIPATVSARQRKLILGVEGCLWTERVATPAYLQFMTLPRLPALAEAAWTPDAERNYGDFQQRLKPYLDQYRRLGWHYYDDANPLGSREEARGPADGQTMAGALQMH